MSLTNKSYYHHPLLISATFSAIKKGHKKRSVFPFTSSVCSVDATPRVVLIPGDFLKGDFSPKGGSLV